MAENEDLIRENRELRAYLKAFCTATIDPEDRGRDVQSHEANPFITYAFQLVEEEDIEYDRAITSGQVRRAMELVGFDKLKIQPSERTIADELTEARDLRREVKALREAARQSEGRIAELEEGIGPFAAILVHGEPIGPIPRGLLDSKLTRADPRRATALLAAEPVTTGTEGR